MQDRPLGKSVVSRNVQLIEQSRPLNVFYQDFRAMRLRRGYEMLGIRTSRFKKCDLGGNT